MGHEDGMVTGFRLGGLQTRHLPRPPPLHPVAGAPSRGRVCHNLHPLGRAVDRLLARRPARVGQRQPRRYASRHNRLAALAATFICLTRRSGQGHGLMCQQSVITGHGE